MWTLYRVFVWCFLGGWIGDLVAWWRRRRRAARDRVASLAIQEAMQRAMVDGPDAMQYLYLANRGKNVLSAADEGQRMDGVALSIRDDRDLVMVTDAFGRKVPVVSAASNRVLLKKNPAES